MPDFLFRDFADEHEMPLYGALAVLGEDIRQC
jgi:hypothetical protein